MRSVPTITMNLCEIEASFSVFDNNNCSYFLEMVEAEGNTTVDDASMMNDQSDHPTAVDDHENRKPLTSSKEQCGADDGKKNNPIDGSHGNVETTLITDDIEENDNHPHETAAPLPSNPSNNKAMVRAKTKRFSTLWKLVFLSALLAVIGSAITLGFSAATRKASAAAAASRALHLSAAPSELPSTLPSVSLSDFPSSVPSIAPSTLPSFPPSQNPSRVPSTAPSTLPSSTPTIAPTPFYIPVNPVPSQPPRGYFNYDPYDNQYGPKRWSRVATSQHPLREFTNATGYGPFRGHLEEKEPLLNMCDAPERRQSPKDLTSTGGVPCDLLDGQLCDCDAHHEIRTKCGHQGLMAEDFTRQILPHKLSLKMNRRKCLDLEMEECDRGRPPIADYPRYSSTLTPFSDLLNFDIKVPGEHTIEGEAFDAEIQMLHTHLDPDPARVSSIGVLIRATAEGYNTEYQQVLNLFQVEYNTHANACRTKQRRHLRRTTPQTTANTNENKDDDLNSTTPVPQQRMDRELYVTDQYRRFNPYAEALMPGIHFYRYDGSITEPPCMSLTWWVMMQPMIISLTQLQQTKEILFSHVDEDCRPTSVHNSDQSVSRPLFSLGKEREIQKCGPAWFQSDIEKGHSRGRKC